MVKTSLGILPRSERVSLAFASCVAALDTQAIGMFRLWLTAGSAQSPRRRGQEDPDEK